MPQAERRRVMRQLSGSLRSIFDWMRDVFSAWGEVASAPAAGVDAGAEEDDG
jgi:hypothetical protein